MIYLCLFCLIELFLFLDIPCDKEKDLVKTYSANIAYCYRDFGNQSDSRFEYETRCQNWYPTATSLIFQSFEEMKFLESSVFSMKDNNMWIGLKKDSAHRDCEIGDSKFYWSTTNDDISVEFISNYPKLCNKNENKCFVMTKSGLISDRDCDDIGLHSICQFKIPICNNIFSHLPSVCSGRGSCSILNNCKCDENYFGDDCEFTTCKEIISSDISNVCSSHGSCESFDTCQCESDLYHGEFCQFSKDHNYVISTPSSSFFSQSGDQIKYHHNNYRRSGQQTEYNHTCFSIPPGTGSCSNHGTCLGHDDCECQKNYYGPKCQEMVSGEAIQEATNKRDEISIEYYLDLLSFYDSDRGKKLIISTSFNCSEIIRNWKTLNLIYNSSKCRFQTKNYFGVVISEKLFVNFIDFEDDSSYNRLNGNFTIEVIPIINETEIVFVNSSLSNQSSSSPDSPAPPPEKGDGGTNEEGEGVDIGLITVISVVSALVFLFPLGVIGMIILVFIFICLLLIAIGLLIFLICFLLVGILTCILSCGTFYLRYKQLKKLHQLENVDLILKQQRKSRKSGGKGHRFSKKSDGSISPTGEGESSLDDFKPNFEIDEQLSQISYEELKLIEVVGEGGGGATVYRCEWNYQDVAFKCFKSSLILGNKKVYEEFEREANLLGSISHPNIIQLFGTVLGGPRIGFVMEFCPGDVDKLIRDANKNKEWITLKEKVRMLYEIASAMAYLHSRNIIHRDLKTENVLLNRDKVCKVMDFGISTKTEDIKFIQKKDYKFEEFGKKSNDKEEEEEEEESQRVGTGIYMSPEVVRGDPYSEKCDVFSFGILSWIVVYQNTLAYGDMTFKGAEIKAASNPFFRPAFSGTVVESNPDFRIPIWLKGLISVCWNHKPKLRRHFDETVVLLKTKLENPEDIEIEYDEEDEDDNNNNTISIEEQQEKEQQEIIENSNMLMDEEGVYIVVKEKYSDTLIEEEQVGKRLLLLEPSYDHLCSLVYETFVEMDRKYDRKKYRIRKIFVGPIVIKNDEDVSKHIKENDLVEIEFLDIEKSRLMNELEIIRLNIVNIKKSNEELQKQLEKKGEKKVLGDGDNINKKKDVDEKVEEEEEEDGENEEEEEEEESSSLDSDFDLSDL